MENKSVNPTEIACIIKKSTFAIMQELAIADINKGDEPLTLYNSTFSRFQLLLISDRKAATANIRLKEIFGLLKRSDYAMNQELDLMFKGNQGSTNQPTSAAYTVRITSGNLKGMTPAEVLLKNDDGMKEMLENQYYFLEKNLAKYPKNKEQMNAIIEAFRLKKEGRLQQTSNQKIPLFATGFRPLTRKKKVYQNQEMCFVYDAKIEWLLGSESPVQVTITNYYAPVISQDNGLLNVKVSQKAQESIVHNTINLTIDEWSYVTHMISTTIDHFEGMFFQEKWKESVDYRKEILNRIHQS